MSDYCIEKKLLYGFSEDVYLLKEKGKYYVYDFEHNLLQISKVIKSERFLKIYNHTIFYWVPSRKNIIKWDYKNNVYSRLKFCKCSDPWINNIMFLENEVIISYKYSFRYPNGDFERRYKIVYIDIESENITKEVDVEKQKNILEKVILHTNELYLCRVEYPSNFNSNKSHFILEKKNDSSIEIIQKIPCVSQNFYKISDNGKYSMFGTIDENNRGKIYIYDFENLKEIDVLDFYHFGFYRLIFYFFEYNNEDYIVFQNNPSLEENESWNTHIYSIKDKKIVKSFEGSVGIESVPNKRMLLIQTSKQRKIIFHKYE